MDLQSAYQWRKNKAAISFAPPGASVEPAITGDTDQAPKIVQIKKVYEGFIRRLLAAINRNILTQSICELSQSKNSGKKVSYERWTTPHPYTIGRPSLYIFGDSDRWSGPLGVCSPVAIERAVDRGLTAEAEIVPQLTAGASLNVQKKMNFVLYAAQDPEVAISIISPYSQESLKSYLHRYFDEVAADLSIHDSHSFANLISNEMYDKYADYLGITGQSTSINLTTSSAVMIIEENSRAELQVEIETESPGSMAFCVVATDTKTGESAASAITGLTVAKSGDLVVDF